MAAVCRDVNLLVPALQPIVTELPGLLVRYGLPFRTYETWRSMDRQRVLVGQGFSRTLVGKHPEGKAFDEVYYGVLPGGGNGWAWVDKAYWTGQGAPWFSDYLEGLYKSLAHVLKGHYPILTSGGLDWKWTDWPHFEVA